VSYFLYTCFAHIVCILEQVNKNILGRHEAHGWFSLLCKNDTDETRTLVQRINNISVGHSHAGAFIIEEKRRFVKSSRHLKRSDKKVRWRCAT